jgi:hypothetical protein
MVVVEPHQNRKATAAEKSLRGRAANAGAKSVALRRTEVNLHTTTFARPTRIVARCCIATERR